MFFAAVRRDLVRHFRRPSQVLNPLAFFAVVTVLFPLGVGPDPGTLRTIAPGIVLAAALLASLMSLDSMFRDDDEDGSLEQVVVSGRPLAPFVLAKACAHWLASGLPLALLAPVAALTFRQDPGLAALSLLLVTPTLSLVGAIGGALTLGLPRGGLLVTLIVLPLYTPLLIFAAAMAQAGAAGASVRGHAYWLAALALLAAALAPPAAAAAVRLAVDR